MKSNTHREPTPEELKEHKKNHPNVVKAIVDAHRKVVQVVKKNYGRDTRVVRYD